MKRILTAKQVDRAMDALYRSIRSRVPADSHIAVIGIRTRGKTLAERIVRRLREDLPDAHIESGALDITFYRDDLSRRRGVPLVRATEIDFDLDETWTLLVDDVMQTGRSIRAALDALHDFGRPKVIRLAVLIDRGGREVPVSPDFTGKTVEADSDKRVQVKLKENDGEEGVFIIPKP